MYPQLLFLACIGPAALGLLHISLLGRASHDAAWLAHAIVNTGCSALVARSLVSSHFRDWTAPLVSITLLTALIFFVNWTVSDGSRCMTMH